MKVKAILNQLFVAIKQFITRKDTYPSAYIWGYWECYVDKHSKVRYRQFKSLWNYITNKRNI